MNNAPKKIWIPLNQVPSLVDVSDGRLIKGPGPYYVRDDIADKNKRQRDLLLKAMQAILEWNDGTLPLGDEPWLEMVEIASAAIAECEKEI